MNLVKIFMDEEVKVDAEAVVAPEADPAQSFVQVEEPVVEEKVDEEVVVDVPTEEAVADVSAEVPVESAIEMPIIEIEVPQVAVQDVGIVLSANTTASPVDVPLNISA